MKIPFSNFFQKLYRFRIEITEIDEIWNRPGPRIGSESKDRTFIGPEISIPTFSDLNSNSRGTDSIFIIRRVIKWLTWFIEQTQYQKEIQRNWILLDLPILPKLYESLRSKPYMLRSPLSSKIKILNGFIFKTHQVSKPGPIERFDFCDYHDFSWLESCYPRLYRHKQKCFDIKLNLEPKVPP